MPKRLPVLFCLICLLGLSCLCPALAGAANEEALETQPPAAQADADRPESQKDAMIRKVLQATSSMAWTNQLWKIAAKDKAVDTFRATKKFTDAEVDAMAAAFAATVWEDLAQGIQDAQINFCRDNFSPSELDELNAFYSTPTGQKAAAIQVRLVLMALQTDLPVHLEWQKKMKNPEVHQAFNIRVVSKLPLEMRQQLAERFK